MFKFFKVQCKSCGNFTFSFLDKWKLIEGKEVKCNSCRKKFIGTEPWKSIYGVLVSISPFVVIGFVIFFDFWLGVVFSITTLTLLTITTACVMPVKEKKIKAVKPKFLSDD